MPTYQPEPFIESYTGLKFYFDAPAPDMIEIADIAHSLSMQCRFGGHCSRFYSVAEHSVLMASHYIASCGKWEEDYDIALAILLHDAAEAYIRDLPRPIKYALPQYRTYEAKVERLIAAKFGLAYPFPQIVKDLDNRILVDERTQNMSATDNVWGIDEFEPLGVTLKFWAPDEAERQFLKLFSVLHGY